MFSSISKLFTSDRPNSLSKDSSTQAGEASSRTGSVVGAGGGGGRGSRQGSFVSVNDFYATGTSDIEDGFEFRKNRDSNLSGASFEAVQPRRSDIKLPSIDLARPAPSLAQQSSQVNAEKKLNIQSTYRQQESSAKHKYIPKVLLDLQVRIDQSVGDDLEDDELEYQDATTLLWQPQAVDDKNVLRRPSPPDVTSHLNEGKHV